MNNDDTTTIVERDDLDNAADDDARPLPLPLLITAADVGAIKLRPKRHVVGVEIAHVLRATLLALVR